LLDRCAAVGERVLGALRASLREVPAVVDVRGRGCLVGVELASAEGVLERLRERGCSSRSWPIAWFASRRR
jgi:4-aminobutyrate aminotransferase-like enzyme